MLGVIGEEAVIVAFKGWRRYGANGAGSPGDDGIMEKIGKILLPLLSPS